MAFFFSCNTWKAIWRVRYLQLLCQIM